MGHSLGVLALSVLPRDAYATDGPFQLGPGWDWDRFLLGMGELSDSVTGSPCYSQASGCTSKGGTSGNMNCRRHEPLEVGLDSVPVSLFWNWLPLSFVTWNLDLSDRQTTRCL